MHSEAHESAALKQPEKKYVRVLRRLLDGPLHRFEAEKFPVSDHVLNSTVSELKKRGLNITSDLVCLPANDDDGSPMRSASAIEYIPVTVNASPFTSSNWLDSVIDVVGQVKERYLQESDRVAFVMHRLTVAKLRKTKASTAGSYLWGDAANGEPPTLCGFPVLTCDAMGLTTTLNAHPILFGNFRRGYLLADRTGMEITLDPYSTPGLTRFYARRRVGGCVKNNDAIKSIKVAIS